MPDIVAVYHEIRVAVPWQERVLGIDEIRCRIVVEEESVPADNLQRQGRERGAATARGSLHLPIPLPSAALRHFFHSIIHHESQYE